MEIFRSLPCFVIYFYCYQGDLGPIKNFTTVTVYTDPHTWNKADDICKSQGGQLLDITRFSLFSALLTFASESTWKNLPVGNGPPAWLGLHRQVTPLGDRYYSGNCVPLEQFKIVYWNTDNPYTTMDGDATSFCVYNYVNQSTSGTVTSYKHDYTRANCSEQHRFYCQAENGPCQFEKVPGFHGDTSQDFSPGNDVIYPYEGDAKCAELCFNSSTIFPHPDLLVEEECWGYTTTSTECYIHLVIKPFYFDASTSRVASVSSTLSIKRCYASSVDSSIFDVPRDDSQYPNTTCGTPETGLSTMTTRAVFVYPGLWTWNNAYSICNMHGQNLLKLSQQDDYTALQQIVNKYKDFQNMEYIWLGLHEPDPVNHTDIRVWSDCSAGYTSNWDTNASPSSSLLDTALCVTMETSTSLWYTDDCNVLHNLVCMGEFGFNRSYSLGQPNKTGSGTQLGPYIVPESTCRDMCTRWTYEYQECWGYAVKLTGVHIDTECMLFFQNISGATAPNNHFTFFYKLAWTDMLMNNSELTTLATDMSILPRSCCDVTGLRSQCPENIYPVTNLNLPTTTKTELILHTTKATWNEADAVCRSNGGRILQVDDVTKRTMVMKYINDWVAMGVSWTKVWMGLAQIHADDSCSLRWTKDCSVPLWTEFSGTSYVDKTNDRCVAVDQNLKFTKNACNTRLMFVCEADIGPCTFSNVVNVKCDAGLEGATYSLSTTACMDVCRLQTYLGMECWTASMSGSSTCDLFFYKDPMYCAQDSGAVKRSFDTVFKICYAASVKTSDVILPNAFDVIPNHRCDSLIPDSLKIDVCNTKVSLTPTLTLSTTTMSPTEVYTSSSAQATTYPSNTAVLASTTSILPSYISSSPRSVSAMLSKSDTTSDTLVTTPLVSSISPSFDTLASMDSPIVTNTLQVNPSYSTASTNPATTVTHLVTASVSVPTLSPTFETTSSLDQTITLDSATASYYSPTAISNALSTSYSMTVSPIFVVTASSATLIPDPVITTPSTSTFTPNSSLSQTSARPIYILACLCYTPNDTKMTMEEWHEWFVSANEVNIHKTSRYRRRLTSVHDGRTSTQTIGIIASVLIVGLAAYLITTDIPRIVRGLVLHRRELYTTKRKK